MSVSPTAENMVKPISIGLNHCQKVTSTTGSNKPSLVYSGLTGRVLVGEDVVVGNVLYPVRSVGAMEWKKIDADAIATMPGLAYVLEAASDGTYALVLFWGFCKNTSENFGVKAAGTLSMATKPTATDTVTIGDRVYEFVAAVADVAAETNVPVLIGADVAASKVNLVAAITADTNAVVTVAAFSGDNMVATAKAKGTAGSLIATTETFTDETDAWGAATLGDTTEGSEGGVLYCSTTAGGLTLTAPTVSPDVVQEAGYAISAEQFFFRPELEYAAL